MFGPSDQFPLQGKVVPKAPKGCASELYRLERSDAGIQ